MKKKYLPAAVIFIMILLLSAIPASAMTDTDDVIVYIKGSYFCPIPEDGYEVVIKDDRTFLPLRYVAETLNYQVDWDQSTQGISMTSGDTSVNMNVGNNGYTVNGVQKTMDTEPFIQSDRTYVPLRFAAEAFGEKVQWDNNNRTAVIGSYSDHDLSSQPGVSVELKKAGLFINVQGDELDGLVIEDNEIGTAIYDKASYDAYKADGSVGGWIVTVYRQDYPDVDMYSSGILLDYVDGVYIQAQLPSDVQAYLLEGDEQPYVEPYFENYDMVQERLKHILLSEEEGRGGNADTSTVRINTYGLGEIQYAEEGESLEFNDEYPVQSIVVNAENGTKLTIAAKPDHDWNFQKWTKDGADYSEDSEITVTVTGDTEYIAVFGFE